MTSPVHQSTFARIPPPLATALNGGIVLLATALLVVSAVLMHAEVWPVWPSALGVVGALFVAFLALSWPVVPLPPATGRVARFGLVVLPLIAAVPAVVSGLTLSSMEYNVSIRAAIVFSAACYGTGLRLNHLRQQSEPVVKWHWHIDAVRQGLLTGVLAIACVLYVSMPVLV